MLNIAHPLPILFLGTKSMLLRSASMLLQILHLLLLQQRGYFASCGPYSVGVGRY